MEVGFVGLRFWYAHGFSDSGRLLFSPINLIGRIFVAMELLHLLLDGDVSFFSPE